MRWSWQNFSDGKRSGFWSGRAWLWLGREPAVRVEWHHRKPERWTDCRVMWTSWGWRRFQANLQLLFVDWYVTVGEGEFFGRETGLSLHEDHGQIKLRYLDANGDGPDRGWKWSGFLLDKLLGRAVYTEGPETFSNVLVPMPERAYAGVCRLQTNTWKRPRWPWATRREMAQIDMAQGEQVPHPGKGESSWDCDEDATYGISLKARTVSEAVTGMVGSVLRSRERHGGSVLWKPREKAALTTSGGVS